MYESELKHFLGLGQQAQNHKYFARINLGSFFKPNYRYFYTKAEWDAYQKTKTSPAQTSTATNQQNTLGAKLESAVKSVIPSITGVVNKAQGFDSSSPKDAIRSYMDSMYQEYESAVNNYNKDLEAYKRALLVNDAANKIAENERKASGQKERKIITTLSAIGGIITGAYGLIRPIANIAKARSEQKERDDISEIRNRESDEARSARLKVESDLDVIQNLNQEIDRLSRLLLDSDKKDDDYKKPSLLDMLKRRKDDETDKEAMARVNPNFDSGDYDYTNNCALCTIAYDLRKRGYDVEAAEAMSVDQTTYNIAQNIYGYDIREPDTNSKEYRDAAEASWNDSWAPAYKYWFGDQPGWNAYDIRYSDSDNRKGAIDPDVAAEKIRKELLAFGDGARGNFETYWRSDGPFGNSAHSVVWEVVDGEVILRDCQANTIEKLEDFVLLSNFVSYYRTDDREISNDAMALQAVHEKKDDTYQIDKGDYSWSSNHLDSVEYVYGDKYTKKRKRE